MWKKELPPNHEHRTFILEGIQNGFDIVQASEITHTAETHNYKSATNPHTRNLVEKAIRNEIDNGHYKIVQEKPNIVSALGAIPKNKGKSVRLIHDCSRPSGRSLNDFASHEKFKYQSIQDAVDLVTKNAYLAKVDLSSAYRSVKINDSNYTATGLKWRFSGDDYDTYMVDTRLPFGAKKSPEIFHILSQAVRAIMKSKGYNSLVVYIDDFLIISPDFKTCQETLKILMKLLRELGFGINYSKLEGPIQCLTFLGIQLDTRDLTLKLSADKLKDLQVTLVSTLAKSKVTKRQLQSLAGKLNWATQVIYGGRYHLRRLIDRITSLKRPWHRTRITTDIKKDITWWLEFMEVFNGSVSMIDSRSAISVCIDACLEATGGYFNKQCVYVPFVSNTISDLLPINYKEVLALEPAAQLWCQQWSNHKVYIHTDNQAAAAIINKGSCRDPFVMNSLRRVFWLSAIYNFRVKAVYYPGSANTIADAVSRLHEAPGCYRLDKTLGKILNNECYTLSTPIFPLQKRHN